MGTLKVWVKENSNYLKIQDGETVEVVFKKYEFIKSTFDPDKQAVRYTLGTPFGEKTWDTSASNVAEFFDEVKPEQKVKITRQGTGANTSYKLSIIEK